MRKNRRSHASIKRREFTQPLAKPAPPEQSAKRTVLRRIFLILQLILAVSLLVGMIYFYLQSPRYSAPKVMGLMILWIILTLRSLFRTT